MPVAALVSVAFAECHVGYEAQRKDGTFRPLSALMLTRDGVAYRTSAAYADWSAPRTQTRERAVLPAADFAEISDAIASSHLLSDDPPGSFVEISDSRDARLLVDTASEHRNVSTSRGSSTKIERASAVIAMMKNLFARIPEADWTPIDTVPLDPVAACTPLTGTP